MVDLVTINPGEFENDPNADDLWQFAKATDENLKRLLAGVMARAMLIIGDQRLLPFRATELPAGWYFMDGRKFLLSSDQGQVLNNLPTGYKTDFGIAVTSESGSQYINVPKSFYTDGRGYVERAVDGITRQVGSIEQDAMRNIAGRFSINGAHASGFSGAFTGSGQASVNATGSQYASQTIDFSAATAGLPIATEIRMINIGKTPAIFLGV